MAIPPPVTQWFARFVERLLPAKESPFTRTLDPAALVNPVVTIEVIQRVVAEALRVPTSRSPRRSSDGREAAHGVSALAEALEFLSALKTPPVR